MLQAALAVVEQVEIQANLMMELQELLIVAAAVVVVVTLVKQTEARVAQAVQELLFYAI